MAKEENEIDFQEETINLEDPFKMDYDPFELEDISLDKDKEEEEEEEEEVKPPKAPKEEKQEEQEEEQEEEELEEEEKEKIDPQLNAGISIARFIAQKKGVDEQIDFDAIESIEDLQDVLDSFDDLDSAIAVERLKQTDSTIAKIVDYVQKGGNSNDIIGILTQSKEIAAIDIETESGCKQVLKDYYKKVVGFDDEKVAARIKKFEDSDMLMEEAKDILPLYQEKLNKEVEEKTAQLEKEKIIKENKLKQTQIDFVEQLKANKYSREVASRFYQTAFSDVALPDGTRMNLLDAKIKQLRETPEGLFKLSSFLTDTDFYDNQVIATKGSKIIADKTSKRLTFNNNKQKESSGGSAAKPASKTGIQLKF